MVSLGIDTHQWYQSRRSSAAHQKIEKETEIETNRSDFPPPCRYDKLPETFDEKLSLALKRIDELIERNKKSSQKMIDNQFRQRDHSDVSSNYVSTDPRKFGCEEASIEESSLSANGEESHPFVEAGAILDFQVSLQTKNSKSYKKYKHYSAVELDDRRDRGLCLWCDEIFFIGHECCKKKLYVYEIDSDEDLAVSENSLVEPSIDVKLVEEEVSHCDEHLVEDCVQNNPILLGKFMAEEKGENEEMSEVLGKDYKAEKLELQVFDKMFEKYTFENIAENCVAYTICAENEKLGTLGVALKRLTVSLTSKPIWLYDEGSGNLRDTVVADQLLKHIGALFSRLSILEGFNQSWIAWPELPVPPPEPPPRFTSTLDCNKSVTSKVYKRRTIVLLPFASDSITMERYSGVVRVQSLLLENCTALLKTPLPLSFLYPAVGLFTPSLKTLLPLSCYTTQLLISCSAVHCCYNTQLL